MKVLMKVREHNTQSLRSPFAALDWKMCSERQKFCGAIRVAVLQPALNMDASGWLIKKLVISAAPPLQVAKQCQIIIDFRDGAIIFNDNYFTKFICFLILDRFL